MRKGRSIRVRVPLSFEEAYSGTDKKLALNDNVACTECKGSGAAQDGLSTCGHCNGSGQVVTRSGFFAMQTTCSRCGGRGSTITARCDACKGVGAIEEHRTVPVTIPAGVGSGDSMGVPSEGEMGPNGGPRGDLILVFDVAKHERFERDGIELHTEIPISFFQAALGDKIKLETVDSEESLKIEPGSQPGDIVRLRRKGMPDPNSGRRGDLHCHLQVSVPKRLSRKQRKALEGIRSILETEE